MRLIALTMALLAATAAAPTSAVAQRFTPMTAAPYDGTSGHEPGDPRLFSVKLPEGNYRVTVTLGDPRRASVTTIKAESRRLMLDAVAVPRGRTVTRSFVVNVRTPFLAPPPVNAPGGTAVRLKQREQGSYSWDDRLTLEILGDTAAVQAIEIAPVEVPTLYLLGDSTVTDQRAEPAASWGQMLTAFVGPDLAVANHAESGETLKSFVTELRLDKALSRVKPGDWAMIQFGHNDQKAQWPQTHAPAATTYRDWLRTFVAEFRRRGATPILVTSPERRNWTGDRIKPTLADYTEAVRAVAAEQKVPLIDLNAASIAFYEALGPVRAPLAFNDGGKDATHHDNYGAWVLARSVAEGVRTSGLPLARLLAPGLAPFDPAHPPAPETFRIAPSVAFSDQRPAGN
jgi:lysophospholipase L1-like esterase